MRARFLGPCVALALLWCVTGAWAQSTGATAKPSIATLKEQAANGDAVAQYNLGEAYENGKGVPQDDAQAALWFRKAAEQNLAIAQYRLGVLYANGLEVRQDWTQAGFWFRKAANGGMAEAQFLLGSQLESGQGLPQNTREALMWFHAAAEQGYADAQNQLGILYEEGGPMKSVQESGGESRLVPASGDASIPKDYALAAIWYHKAAEQNDPSAQSSLALLYENGQGVPQDYSEAYFWMNLAAANGNGALYSASGEWAPARDRIAAYLTKTDLLKVQERGRKWFEDHPAKQ